MEVDKGMSKNMNGWGLWCGVGCIEESHEEIRDLTKTDAIKLAFQKSKEWPRVHVVQYGAKYPRGAIVAVIEHGWISGRIFDEMPEKLFAEIQEI